MSDPVNPFGGPFAGAGHIGGNPMENAAHAGPRCPVCTSQNFHAWTHQYGVSRRCLDCGNEWSGGTVAAARPSFLEPPPPPDGMVLDDPPVIQYTGANFRDPSKNFGDDDY